MNFKQTARTRMSGNCIEESMTSIVKDERGDLIADCHGVLARWKNFVFQLLDLHSVSDVRQI